MNIEFEISGFINAKPKLIYNAWLDSDHHSAMTGGDAFITNAVGDSFHAWDGYIEGVNLELEPGKKIIQHWRTTEFAESDEYSLVEIYLEAEGSGTLITIHHSKLPKHGMQYKQGWIDHYFNPMKLYFDV